MDAILSNLKLYFQIEDDSKDELLTLIINTNADILKSLNADPVYIFSMSVWDYSNYLKGGTSSFQVSQSTDITRFDPDLRDLIYRSIPIRVLP